MASAESYFRIFAGKGLKGVSACRLSRMSLATGREMRRRNKKAGLRWFGQAWFMVLHGSWFMIHSINYSKAIIL